ncbi:MAG: hypothetical protein ACM3TU_02715 [Bacillota bacterium]
MPFSSLSSRRRAFIVVIGLLLGAAFLAAAIGCIFRWNALTDSGDIGQHAATLGVVTLFAGLANGVIAYFARKEILYDALDSLLFIAAFAGLLFGALMLAASAGDVSGFIQLYAAITIGFMAVTGAMLVFGNVRIPRLLTAS